MEKTLFAITALILITALPKPEKLTGREPSVNFSSSNLPIFVIDTHGKTIVDPRRITADLGIIYNGPGQRNNITDPFNHFSGKIAIELRGSSSAAYPKNSTGSKPSTRPEKTSMFRCWTCRGRKAG
ncbi:hypothetical protein JW935_21330 [candidate division KSB1 bacterium]|nr:hypothetical protein [candidate division KSB1 bacterium]